MEAHVCVFQTVRDLVQQGYQVFVPQDAVISRTGDNLRVGLSLTLFLLLMASYYFGLIPGKIE